MYVPVNKYFLAVVLWLVSRDCELRLYLVDSQLLGNLVGLSSLSVMIRLISKELLIQSSKQQNDNISIFYIHMYEHKFPS